MSRVIRSGRYRFSASITSNAERTTHGELSLFLFLSSLSLSLSISLSVCLSLSLSLSLYVSVCLSVTHTHTHTHIKTTTLTQHPLSHRYNRLCGAAKKIATRLSKLDPTDPFRQKRSDALLEKLFAIGLIPTQKNLGLVDKVVCVCVCVCVYAFSLPVGLSVCRGFEFVSHSGVISDSISQSRFSMYARLRGRCSSQHRRSAVVVFRWSWFASRWQKR